MPAVSLSNGSVHYTEHGHGVPLVLLHANPGDGQDFEAVIPALSKSCRVLALDWPGYGQSDMPQQPESAGVLLFYEVLREFLTALALPPAFFIGNSVGGNATARLASESPELVRGLVLVAPGGLHSAQSRHPQLLPVSRQSLFSFTPSFCQLVSQTSHTRSQSYVAARFHRAGNTGTNRARPRSMAQLREDRNRPATIRTKHQGTNLAAFWQTRPRHLSQ